MRALTLLFFIALFAKDATAQFNHVPNCSFEEYTTCPWAFSQTAFCKGWRSYTTGSSDFFNVCCSTINVSIPKNYFGEQQPAHGSGYAGGYTYNQYSEYKEYLATQIIPLTPGQNYEVSMSVSLCDKSKYATNGLGAFFYKDGPDTFHNFKTLDLQPQVSYNHYGVIKDSVNWVRLKQYFRADSAYDHIVVGGFLDTLAMRLDEVNPASGTRYAYYYIDSIVVTPVSNIFFNYTDTLLCAGDTLSLPYTVSGSFAFNNSFTAQLSDASGSFLSPTNVGTVSSNISGAIFCTVPKTVTPGKGYRIRIVSSAIADTSFDNYYDITIGNPGQVVAENNGPICADDTLKLNGTSGRPGVKIFWNGPGGFNADSLLVQIPNPTIIYDGDYILQAEQNGCIVSDTTTAIVHDGYKPRNVTAMANTPVCTGDTLKLFATATGSASFDYDWRGPGSVSFNEQNPVVTTNDTGYTGTYILTVSNGGCEMKDTIQVVVKQGPEKPLVYNTSPVYIRQEVLIELKNPTPGAVVRWTGPNGFSGSFHKYYLQQVSMANAGRYVLITELNDCIDTASTEVVIYDIKDTGKIVVYPNPNNGNFTIKGLLHSNASIPIQVISVMGRLVHREELIPVNNELVANIQLEGLLPSGVYFLRMLVEGKIMIVPVTVYK